MSDVDNHFGSVKFNGFIFENLPPKNKNQRKFLVNFFIKKIDMLATAVLTR